MPVGGRPIVDRIVDNLAQVAEVDEVHVVTNARKAPAFDEWASGRDVTVHDDGTTSNDDRLGAIGDMLFVVDRIGVDDDLLVIAGDNLFDFQLRDLVAFWRSKGVASAVALRDVGSLELAAAVRHRRARRRRPDLARSSRSRPSRRRRSPRPRRTSTTAPRAADRATYLDEGDRADQPGRLVAWLHQREPVYGWVFDRAWFDIGDHEQLLEADNRLRAAARAARARAAYEPS